MSRRYRACEKKETWINHAVFFVPALEIAEILYVASRSRCDSKAVRFTHHKKAADLWIKLSVRSLRSQRQSLVWVLFSGDGNKNWQYNATLGVGYHFHWADVSLVVRNLTYQVSDSPVLEKVRMTGPAIGAAFHW
jgi:hypothetical protein